MNEMPKLPAGYRWEVHVSKPGRNNGSSGLQVSVSIVYLWFITEATESVFVWHHQTKQEMTTTTARAARKAFDQWQANRGGDTIQDWAHEIELELNA